MAYPDIGEFVIGESPIGGIPPALDFNLTLISQYYNSPILYQLISNFQDYIDPTANLESFFDLIWNISSAQGYGLDVWGRIVGVGRVLQIPGTTPYFGFEEATDTKGFNLAPFYFVGGLSTNISLEDNDFRTLILAKALANVCDGSIPAINQILLNLFATGGKCYVIDNQNMTMVYNFNFHLTPVDKAIIAQSGILPRPCGVSVTIASL